MPQNIVAFPRLSMLTCEQCEVVHRASLEILRRMGVRVHHDGTLALLRETDAVVTDGFSGHALSSGIIYELKEDTQWQMKGYSKR